MVLNPQPEEWIAIIVFLVTGFLPPMSLILSAYAHHYREWLAHPQAYRPYWFQPEFFGWIFTLVYLLISIAAFLTWREGFRSANIPPGPISGDTPGDDIYISAMIIYTTFWGLSIAIGPVVFQIGLGWGWLIITFVFGLVLLGCAVALTVLFWTIWLVPGIMMLVGAVGVLYGCYVALMFWWAPVIYVADIANPFTYVYKEFNMGMTYTEQQGYYMPGYNGDQYANSQNNSQAYNGPYYNDKDV